MVTSYIGRVRFHRERARLFHLHAAHTKSPDGREMYLRLARVEVALAEQNELLVPGSARTGTRSHYSATAGRLS